MSFHINALICMLGRSHALFLVFFTVGDSYTTPSFWSLRVFSYVPYICFVFGFGSLLCEIFCSLWFWFVLSHPAFFASHFSLQSVEQFVLTPSVLFYEVVACSLPPFAAKTTFDPLCCSCNF